MSPGAGRLGATLRRSRAAWRPQMSAAGRLPELTFRQPDEAGNAAIDRLCQAAERRDLRLSVADVEGSVSGPVCCPPLCTRILHSYALRSALCPARLGFRRSFTKRVTRSPAAARVVGPRCPFPAFRDRLGSRPAGQGRGLAAFPAWSVRPLPSDPPGQPCTVPVYDPATGTGQMLAVDLDPTSLAARSSVSSSASSMLDSSCSVAVP